MFLLSCVTGLFRTQGILACWWISLVDLECCVVGQGVGT